MIPSSRLAAAAVAFATLTVTACAGHVLDVGEREPLASTDAGGNAAGVQYSGYCVVADRANQQLTCAGGVAATDLTCTPNMHGAYSVYVGTCILAGECPDDAGTPVCATTPLPVTTSCISGSACPSATVTGGSGIVSLEIDAPTGSTPTETLSAFFTSAQPTTEDSDPTFGSCVYDTDFTPLFPESGVTGPVPNPGVITVGSGDASLAAQPICDGTYPDAQGTSAPAAGSLLPITWTTPLDNPWGFATPYTELTVPHSITLSPGGALGTAASLPRTLDAQLTWTTAGTPLELEQVVVQLVQGQDSLTCTFPTSAGAGTVPSDALLQLGPGTTTYAVYAQHQFAQTAYGYPSDSWEITYRARAVAITASGLAQGQLTLQ